MDAQAMPEDAEEPFNRDVTRNRELTRVGAYECASVH